MAVPATGARDDVVLDDLHISQRIPIDLPLSPIVDEGSEKAGVDGAGQCAYLACITFASFCRHDSLVPSTTICTLIKNQKKKRSKSPMFPALYYCLSRTNGELL